MWRTSEWISSGVSDPPNAGMRGLRFMTSPPEAIVSYSASSDRALIAAREA
jgi:hypothetical protein